MRTKIIVPFLIIMFVFVFRLSIEKDKIDSYEIVYEKVDQTTHDIYYYDNNKLVFVSITFDGAIEVEYLFDLLTNKSNTIKEEYDTKLIVSTTIIDYYVNDDILTINLSEDFLRYNTDDSYEIFIQLRNTFSNLGYTTLVLNVENVLIDKIGHINISEGIVLSNI